MLKSFRKFVRRQIQVGFWGMDIHPTVDLALTAYVDRTWPKGIHIEAGCTLGEEAVVLTHDLTRGLYLDTRIGRGTVIGPRAIVLPGVSIGEDCVVMPGAFVNRDVPAWSVAMGNPAKVSPRTMIDAGTYGTLVVDDLRS